MNRNKNIAILVSFLHSGGAERIAGLLSEKLSNKYNVYLFILDTENIVYAYGGEIIDVSVNGMENIESTIMYYKKKLQIDCTISFLEVMNYINIRTRCNDSIIISQRGAIGKMKNYPIGESVKIKKWYNYADKIISCAYGVEYDLIHNFGVNEELITTIYNFIDKENLLKEAQADIDRGIKEFIKKSRLILNVGRLDASKNHQKLLVQFAHLVKHCKDVKLIIMGTGVLKNQIESLIEELELQSFVKLIPYQKNPFSIYKLADMLVVSSDYEGLPNVILEAFLLELPVIAVDCLSGPRELLSDMKDYSQKTQKFMVCDRGILVQKSVLDENGTTSYLSDAMEYLLEHPETADSIKNNAFIYMKRYSNERIENKWIELIEEVKPTNKAVLRIDMEEILSYRKIIVYGIGVYGKNTMRQILPYKKEKTLYFAVSDKTQKGITIFDIPVFNIHDLLSCKDEAIVLIGVSYTFENEIVMKLEQLGFKYIYPEF